MFTPIAAQADSCETAHRSALFATCLCRGYLREARAFVTLSPSMKFYCPHCQQKCACTSEMIGHEVECPKCGNGFIVPEFEVKVSATPTTVQVRAQHAPCVQQHEQVKQTPSRRQVESSNAPTMTSIGAKSGHTVSYKVKEESSLPFSTVFIVLALIGAGVAGYLRMQTPGTEADIRGASQRKAMDVAVSSKSESDKEGQQAVRSTTIPPQPTAAAEPEPLPLPVHEIPVPPQEMRQPAVRQCRSTKGLSGNKHSI